MRRVKFIEGIAFTTGGLPTYRIVGRKGTKVARPRTTLHIYCSLEEARQIRRAARLGRMTICGFVLESLRRSWQIQESMQAELKTPRRTKLS